LPTLQNRFDAIDALRPAGKPIAITRVFINGEGCGNSRRRIMQWEYSIVSLSGAGSDRLKSQLDAQGREGWELATIVNDGAGHFAVFKRAREPIAHVMPAA
jgi:hypothetical protein